MNDTSEWLERIASEVLNDGVPDSLREFDDAPLLEWVVLLGADFGDVCRATDGRGEWGTPEWARNQIRRSVMGYSDFARYVIGVDVGANSSSQSSKWLEKGIGEALWESYHDRLDKLLRNMDEDECLAYDEFQDNESSIFQRYTSKLRLLNTETDGVTSIAIETPEERDKQFFSCFREAIIGVVGR